MITFSSRVYLVTGTPLTTLNPWPKWISREIARSVLCKFGRGNVSWLMKPSGVLSTDEVRVNQCSQTCAPEGLPLK